jgi:hypothetical protein
MATMLPATPAAAGSISDVAENLIRSLTGKASPWGWQPVTKIALVVIDGLGLHNLLDHSGHARFLARNFRESGQVLFSGLPSTTASALASLTTGSSAGTHGMLGYSVRDGQTRALVNHLKPFPDGIEPESWQPVPTVFDRLGDHSIASQAIGEARFEGTDFTRAVLRGATFTPSHSLDGHLSAVRDFFDTHDTGLSYVYWPGIDRAGHSEGVGSEAWLDELEKVDRWVATLADSLAPGEACVVTADHGMIAVAEKDRVVFPAGTSLRSDIDVFGGEPRMLHLYAQEGVAEQGLARAVAGFVDHRGRVFTRDEACRAGLFGVMAPWHRERVGDVVVLAQESWVFYDEATASASSYRMIGQHGSDSAVETMVPLMTAGDWGR